MERGNLKKMIGRLSLASYVLEISKCNVAQRAESCCSQKSGERRRGFSFPTRLISTMETSMPGGFEPRQTLGVGEKSCIRSIFFIVTFLNSIL